VNKTAVKKGWPKEAVAFYTNVLDFTLEVSQICPDV
jgi:hypothetical protein